METLSHDRHQTESVLPSSTAPLTELALERPNIVDSTPIARTTCEIT
jgi:hypothetical protein